MISKLKLPTSLVSVKWLAAALQHPRLIVLDSSLKIPVNKTTSLQSSSQRLQIPQTRYFDFEHHFCDLDNSLPHMMPSETSFVPKARELGICNNSVIVVYDNRGIYSSPRAWWMFKAMGHPQVAVLDGGLPAWLAAGLPCEESQPAQNIRTGDFVAKPSITHFCDADRVASALQDDDSVVIDARPKLRFLGQQPEPRSGLRSGHMPGSHNIPFDSVLTTSGCMKSADELQQIFKDKVQHSQQSLIFSCGSGVTACIVALAAEVAGYSNKTVYDASWSEWGLESSLRPVTVADGVQMASKTILTPS